MATLLRIPVFDVLRGVVLLRIDRAIRVAVRLHVPVSKRHRGRIPVPITRHPLVGPVDERPPQCQRPVAAILLLRVGEVDAVRWAPDRCQLHLVTARQPAALLLPTARHLAKEV